MSVNDIVLLIVSVICLCVGLYLTYKNAQSKIEPGATVPTVIFQYMADMAIAIQDEIKKLDDVSREKYNSDEEYRKQLVALAVNSAYKVLGTSSDLVSKEAITELVSKLLEVVIDKVEDSRKKEEEIETLANHLKIAKEIKE